MTEPRIEFDGVDVSDYFSTMELGDGQPCLVSAVPSTTEPFSIDDLYAFMRSVLDDRYRLESWQMVALNRVYADRFPVRDGIGGPEVGGPQVVFSDVVPPGEVYVFNRDLLNEPFRPGGVVVPMTATVWVDEPEAVRPRSDILDRIDATLTYWSEAAGAEVTVPYNSHPEYRPSELEELYETACEPSFQRLHTATVQLSVTIRDSLTAALEGVAEALRGLLERWTDADYQRRLQRRATRRDPKRLRRRAMHHAYRLRRRGRW